MSLFDYRDYRYLFAAQVVSLFGTGLTTVALGLLAYQLAGADAGAVLGTALTIKMVAYVTIAPVAAAYADRVPRRLMLVGLDLIRASVAVVLPFIDQTWQIYALVAVLQSASAAFTPTFQAVIPDVVTDESDYTEALSASQLASTMESLLSPVLAALALTVMSFHWLFVGTTIGFLVSAALVVLRQAAWVDREPLGFWPRWLYVWGLLAWALALLRLGPPAPAGRRRAAVICTMLVLWFGLDVAGRGLFWCQRPVRRLREIVPGKIYLSGMPTYRGLALAHDRHHFKTIINLFPEYTDEGSPLLSEELAFVRDHGLTYIGNENTEDPTGEAFIARTMEVAQDPDAWPILVHCHASMDRSPAWVGMYRFAVQGWPLADAIREIERHRGLRPKASVTLLFNRVIPLLARDRAAHDPTLPLLRECARGTKDPALSMMSRGDRIVVPREAMAEETPLTERR